ncbi:hypothetical protein P4O66_014840, partial [Electrophorus voltai]
VGCQSRAKKDRDLEGHSCECTADLHSHSSPCSSIQVEGRYWTGYEQPNLMGYQYFLYSGPYPDYQWWMGFNACVRSCHMIPSVNLIE